MAELLTIVTAVWLLGVSVWVGNLYGRDRAESRQAERLAEARRLLTISQQRLNAVSEENLRLRRLLGVTRMDTPTVPEWMEEDE